MSKLLVGSATDVGLVRSNNQDQLLVAAGLYAVADGMGGHAAGEVASATAIRALQAAFEASDQHSAESLESAAKAANRAVWEQARTNRGMLGMGTTLVALAVVENDDGTNGLAVAHIGDSRLYLFRDQALCQLTVDHSLVQELVDDGQISQAQAAVHPQRHVLTRALGVEPSVDVDVIPITPVLGDRYVLCSDGLPREASDDQIAAVLARFVDPTEAAKELVALAKSRGGSDNITVVMIDVLANDSSPDTLIVVPGPASSARSRSPDPTGELDGTGPEGPGTAARNGRRPLTAGPGETTPAEAGPHPIRLTASSPSRVTWRVVGFVVAVCFVIGGSIACLGWYARSAYFVTISQGRITIFQGRPGGILWFQPTLADRTSDTPSSVETFNLPILQAGQLEPSLAQAESYIQRLVSEKREAEAVTPPGARGAPRSRPTTTTTPTTTTPTTTLAHHRRAKPAAPATASAAR
jgi:PPM family protein phosphatase